MNPDSSNARSWYQYFWPWFIIGLLFITIVGCIMTIYLAIHFPDQPLNDQYYKVGLSVYERDASMAKDD